MKSKKASGKKLLSMILEPFLKLSINLIETSEKSDLYSGRIMLAFTALLAGIEKMLNITFILLYISKKIDWDWLKNNRNVDFGYLQCNRGLTAKLNKLEEMGIRKNDLQWIVDLRNEFIHESSMYIGYKIGLSDEESTRLELKASFPEISYNNQPGIKLNSKIIKSSSERITAKIGLYLDSVEWQDAWTGINQKIINLPINPEPEYSKIISSETDEIFSIIRNLNKRLIGEGIKQLI